MLDSAKGKEQSEEKGPGWPWDWEGGCNFSLGGQGDLTEKGTLESRCEGIEGISHANVWKKSLPDREKSDAKALGASEEQRRGQCNRGKWIVHSTNIYEAPTVYE